jgi:hypothetical protein
MLKAIRNWWVNLPLSRGVGFKAAAKNPRLWKAMTMESAQEQAFARQTAATISDGDLADLADYFIFETAHRDEAWLAGRTLQQVDPPRLCHLFEAILKNPANAGRLVSSPAKESKYGPETSIERICRLMDNGICPPSVAEFTGHPEESIRKAAVLAICSRLDACAAPLLYLPILRMVQEGKNCDQSPGTLMLLDPLRAVTDLQSTTILNVDFPRLFEVLRCFREPNALPSREKLEVMFSGLEARPRKYPDDSSLGEVLRLIGHHRLLEDENRLSFYMEEDEDVAEGAASGWLAFHGLEGAHEVACVWDAPASTPVPLKQYYAIHMMDAEICNGGFSQYFFNSSGNSWELAMSGLEGAGSTERLGLLKEATARIAGGKPSPDRETRGHQLAKVLKKNEDAFDDMETRYYASKEQLQVLLTKLVMKHQEIFRSQIEGSR